ncbi:MAG TPA: histidine phosphatase family protein [Candidatus Binataceae bacterium]|nr:histidine phosphatase family protein [Candidatus Binataceae bacterium]
MAERARLVLVRHGETVGNSSVRYYGRTNVALSELGRRQMRAARSWLARRLHTRRFAPVFTSPLVRAVEGARLIAGKAPQAIVIDEFVEVDFGLFEGLTADEIAERYPDEYRQWNAGRLAADFVYPGGESRNAFAGRVGRGTTRMLVLWEAARRAGQGAGAAALMVAHRGVIRAVVQRLAGALEPSIDLGSIHILEHEGNGADDLRAGRWRPMVLDETAHLAELE